MKTGQGQVRGQMWGRPAPRPGEARAKCHAGHSILGNREEKDSLVDRILGIVQRQQFAKVRKRKVTILLLLSRTHRDLASMGEISMCIGL